MTVNAYFNHFNQKSEQGLVESLLIEAVQARGVDVKYIPRERFGDDYFMGEAPISEFKDSYTIEMYIESMENFNGDGDMFAKFGIMFTDKTELYVVASRFVTELKAAGLESPREGDLIYIPFSNSLFEINKSKYDQEYYQTGVNFGYRLICNLFEYSHEKVDTGIADIDSLNIVHERTAVDGNEDDIEVKHTGFFAQDGDAMEKEAWTNFKTFDPENPFGEYDPDAKHERGEGAC
uniref:Neck protein n=1 Tax=Pseudomonas phage Cygsa01 TaxID=3138529 RepID=A0AAU6W3R1_9VIRU